MSETLGDRLRLARQERNLSLAQAAEWTHIRLHYLEALESGDLNRLPSKANARGFLRAYAGFLGVDADGLLAMLDGVTSSPALEDASPAPASTPPTDIPAGGPRLIFKQLGESLQQHRETLGFSLQEVERHTRVRKRYLEALEDGNLDGLPSPVQGRGMLQNYATFLGLDPEPILLRFADGLQARLAERRASAPISLPSRAFQGSDTPGSPTVRSSRRVGLGLLRRWITLDYLLIGALLVLLVGFVVWGVLRINTLRAEQAGQPEATVPSIAEALLATPAEEVTLTQTLSGEITTETPGSIPSEDSDSIGTADSIETLPASLPEQPVVVPTEGAGLEPTLAATLPAIGDAPVQVYVTVLQRAWMRVTVDGEIEFEGRVLPGSAYAFAGIAQVDLLTGNGAALQLFFGDQDLGVLGVYGEVVFRAFTPEGLVLPTPTMTPTPTATTLVTGTPPATVTVPPTPAP